jgi:hypothetical protein
MPPFDRLLYLQARMQAQVLREDIRCMYGVILRTAIGSNHEQAISLHPRRSQSGVAHLGGSEECW